MPTSWVQNTIFIAMIYMFRMLGLFMIIPVFTLYAPQLKDATPPLIGVALGCYGLSQGLLQIPFGWLSDRYGRKKILTLGLVLFTLGSVYGACTHSIYGMIGARILQGTGAIGSVLMALLADLTPDARRTHAMAIIGVTIGASFSLAVIVSPPLAAHFGLNSIFKVTVILALLGLWVLYRLIPTPLHAPLMHDPKEKRFKLALTNRHLQRLNAGIFCQHFILTATFFTVPLLLQQAIHAGHLTQTWHFYLPLMLGSFLLMMPLLMVSERLKKTKPIFLSAIACTALTQAALVFHFQTWPALCGLLFTYFVVFNLLEAHLPSLVSKQADAKTKGTAMGIYSSSQFLGIFAGGALAGLMYRDHGHQAIFILNAVVACVWFFTAYAMQPTQYTFTESHPYTGVFDDTLNQTLRALPGVRDVIYVEEQQIIHLHVEKSSYIEHSASQVLQGKV